MDRAAYRARNPGSVERARAGDKRLTEIGRTEGIDLAFDGSRARPTRFRRAPPDLAGSPTGTGVEVVDALFRAYFQEGKNVGDHAVLTELASEEYGLDADEVRRFLGSEDGISEVEEEESIGRWLRHRRGAVLPVRGGFSLSGAQPPPR